MKRSFQRIIFCLAPATLAALVVGIPTASPDLGLQSTTLSCNDGTNLALALDATSLTALTDAVGAINLFPAGDPALSCALAPAPPGSGNPHYDYTVGGGVVSNVIPCGPTNFAFSAHAPAAPSTSSTPTSGGTFNLSVPATSTCGGAGKLVSKPDCLMNVGGFGSGSAQLTAEVTKVSGSLAAFYSVGQELEADILDSAPDGLGVFRPLNRVPCQQFGFSAYGVVTQGNVTVHNAP